MLNGGLGPPTGGGPCLANGGLSKLYKLISQSVKFFLLFFSIFMHDVFKSTDHFKDSYCVINKKYVFGVSFSQVLQIKLKIVNNIDKRL